MNNDEILIMPGGAIKARRETKNDGAAIGVVEGILCRFTDAEATDSYGDFFDEATDFRFLEGMPCAVYFDHGCNAIAGVKCLAVGVLTLVAEGIAIKSELDLSDAVALSVYERAERGELGWSSGTAGHLVARTQVKSYALHGEAAWHIDHWPLGLDASLTPYPAEPQNIACIRSLKSARQERDEKPKVDAKSQSAGDAEREAQLKAIQRDAILLQADLLRLKVAI